MSQVLRHLLLGLLTLLACLPLAATAESPVPRTGTVTWVVDADTLEVTPHGTVRLLGIDAPEKGPSARDQAFIDLGIPRSRLRQIHGEGLAWSIRNLKGQQVSLTFEQPQRDRHGRLLAYLYLADGRLLNRLLLQQGLVTVYRRFDFGRKEEFLAVEAQAKQRGVGLWTRPE